LKIYERLLGANGRARLGRLGEPANRRDLVVRTNGEAASHGDSAL